MPQEFDEPRRRRDSKKNVIVEITDVHPFSPDASDKRYIFTGKVYGHGYQINGSTIDPTTQSSSSGEDSSAGTTDDPIIVIPGIDKGSEAYPEGPHYAFSAWYEGSQLGGDFSADRNYLVWEIEQPNPPSIIKIAASDSTSGDKDAADKVCDGTEDDVEIRQSINSIAENGMVFLFDGTFYIANPIEFTSSTNQQLLAKSWSLVGNSMSGVIIQPQSGTSPNYALRWYLTFIENYFTNNIAISNLTINGKSTFGSGISVYGRYDEADNLGHVCLSKLTVKNCTGIGCLMEHLPQLVTVQYSFFTNNGDSGLYFRGCPFASVYRSEFTDNGDWGLDIHTSWCFPIRCTTSGNSTGAILNGHVKQSDATDAEMDLTGGATGTATDGNGNNVIDVENGIVTKIY